jgi:hypothetical protein
LDSIAQVLLAFFLNFTRNLMLILCPKNKKFDHSFLRRDAETHHILSAPQPPRNWLQFVEIVTVTGAS